MPSHNTCITSRRHSKVVSGTQWFLGLTVGEAEEKKARHAFVYGDFKRIHRSGLIACVYRASEWDHKDIELAVHDLLQPLDAQRS